MIPLMPIALALGVLQSTRTARKCTTGCKVHHLNHCKVTVRCKASYESCNGSKRFMPHKSESSRRDSLPCEDSHDTGGNSYRMLTTPKTYVHIPLSHTPVTGGRLRVAGAPMSSFIDVNIHSSTPPRPRRRFWPL